MLATLLITRSGLCFVCTLLLVASPLPAVATQADGTNCAPVVEGDPANHCYVMAAQSVIDTHGVGGLFTEPKPDARSETWPWSTKYSIGQLALTSTTDVTNVSEFGWVVDPTLYFDFEPHLFIGLRWKGTFSFGCFVGIPPTEYNDPCPTDKYIPLSQNFPLSPNNRLGDHVGKTGQPMIYHVGYYAQNACGGEKGWWIQYGDEWIGCVKESWFDGGFANGNSIKWYGEVSYETDPCVPMGNGTLGKTTPDAASISNMFYEKMQGTTSLASDAEATISTDMPTDTRYWDYGNFSWSSTITHPKGFNGFHYGGPGKCEPRF